MISSRNIFLALIPINHDQDTHFTRTHFRNERRRDPRRDGGGDYGAKQETADEFQGVD